MILRAENICVSFMKERQKRLFGRERQTVLDGVSLHLKKGECLALVGESGSGKSTLGRVLCGLLKPDSGRVLVDGLDLYGRHSGEERQHLWHKVGIVFQDYTTSVNPRFRVREILGESLRVLGKSNENTPNAGKWMADLLDQVRLSKTFIDRYPHELSGGQLQRVCIARAIAVCPDILVLDEAVSSLDASTQTQVMDLLVDLRQEHGFAYFFITHDLTAVTYMCDRVMFFNSGKVVEEARTHALPEVNNEYARRLLDSVIEIGEDRAC